MQEGLETNAEQKFKRTYGDKKYNTRTINLKSEQKEREKEKDRKIWTFNLVFSFAVETIQASQHVKALRPPWSQAIVELVESPCHSAKTELPLDLLPCYTHVGPWVSLRLSLVQVQSDSLAVHFSSNPIDHCQIRAILRGAVNLSRTAQGTFFLTLSVAQRHLFL